MLARLRESHHAHVTVSNNAAAVRAAGSRLPLSVPLIAEAARGSYRVRTTWVGPGSPPPWGYQLPRLRRSRWRWTRFRLGI